MLNWRALEQPVGSWSARPCFPQTSAFPSDSSIWFNPQISSIGLGVIPALSSPAPWPPRLARLADLVPRPGRNQVATSGWPLLLCPALEAAACAAPSSLAASFYSSLSQCCSRQQPVLPPRASPGCAAARGSPSDARGLCKKWVSSAESPFWMLPALICENPLAVS